MYMYIMYMYMYIMYMYMYIMYMYMHVHASICTCDYCANNQQLGDVVRDIFVRGKVWGSDL